MKALAISIKGFLPVLLVFGLTLGVVGQSMAAPPPAPIYGPEGNAYMNLNNCFVLRVRPGETVTLKFHSAADWENALLVYDGSGSLMVERGNYSRGLHEWSYFNNHTRDIELYISGWHKNGPPNGQLPWYQSPFRVFQDQFGPGFWNGAVGFEDGGGTDFNDVLVRFSIRR